MEAGLSASLKIWTHETEARDRYGCSLRRRSLVRCMYVVRAGRSNRCSILLSASSDTGSGPTSLLITRDLISSLDCSSSCELAASAARAPFSAL